ncbi:MAG: hypothetical protein ACLSXY_05150 [Veillonella sp.]
MDRRNAQVVSDTYHARTRARTDYNMSGFFKPDCRMYPSRFIQGWLYHWYIVLGSDA